MDARNDPKLRARIEADMRAVEAAVLRGAAQAADRDAFARDADTQNVQNEDPAKLGPTEVAKHAKDAKRKASSHAKRGRSNPACKPEDAKPRKSAGGGARITDLRDGQLATLVGMRDLAAKGDLPTQAGLAKAMGKSISQVSRLLGQLQGMEFVNMIRGSTPSVYALTTKGSSAVDALGQRESGLHADSVPVRDAQGQDEGEGEKVGTESSPPPQPAQYPDMVRAHNFQVRLVLHRPPGEAELLQAGWLLDQKMNWKRFTGRSVDGVSLQITPHSILVYLPEIWAKTVEDASKRALDMLKRVVSAFCNQFPKVVLGDPLVSGATIRDEEGKEGQSNLLAAQVLQQHIAFVGDEFAKMCMAEGTSIRSDRIHVDASAGEPELEFVHKVKAPADAVKYKDFVHAVINGDVDRAMSMLRESAMAAYAVSQGLGATSEQLVAMRGLQLSTMEATNFMAKMRAMDMVEARKREGDAFAGLVEADGDRYDPNVA